MRVVICGGGVIGASTAYFLSQRGAEVVVIERRGVACAASGKSGGFLALDWCDGSPLAPLARRSFALHGELAERLDGAAWGYRCLDTYSVVASARQPVDAYRRLPSPDWLGDDAAVHAQLGSTRTTAQVDPAAFTEAMMAAATAAGARLEIGTVTGLAFAANATTVTGAVVDGRAVVGDAVVIAMGPWSLLASRWLPLPPVQGLKGHSLVFDYTPAADARALFVELETDDRDVTSPEMFPRPDGTTYVCGLSSPAPLPLDPAQVTSNADADETLRAMTACFAPDLAAAPVVRAAACYRPVCEDGLPLIGAVPGYAGAYVATGHNVWGMLNGPATGEAMAELIIDGAQTTTVDVTPFDPGRLPALDPTGIRMTDAAGEP